MTHLPDNRRDDEFVKIFRRTPFDHIFAGLLHSRGANVDKKDSKGWSPLLFSARIGEVAALSWLKMFKANMNATDNLGSSALHVASINGNLKAITWLLQNTQIDPNCTNTIGATPLHWCVDMKKFNQPVLEVLINFGANPNAVTVGGWRPIDFARNREMSGWNGDYTKIVHWLTKKNAGDQIDGSGHKKLLIHRDWNPGTPRQLVPCPGGNNQNRQAVSADIFSAHNQFAKVKSKLDPKSNNNQQEIVDEAVAARQPKQKM